MLAKFSLLNYFVLVRVTSWIVLLPTEEQKKRNTVHNSLRQPPRPLRLLSNSSKKSLFFDVLKVTFCYLHVVDAQGSSVVNNVNQTLTTETRRTLRLHREFQISY